MMTENGNVLTDASENAETVAMETDSPFSARIGKGIHILSIILTLVGSVPFCIVAVPIYCGLDTTHFALDILIYLSPFLMMPIALILYLLGKGIGAFVSCEKLRKMSELNRTIFETCFILDIAAWFLISIVNGGLSK